MTKKNVKKMVHSKEYLAEVDVELIYTDDDWSPYLSMSDALKLDEVREALQREDLEVAQHLSKVYRLSPLAV